MDYTMLTWVGWTEAISATLQASMIWFWVVWNIIWAAIVIFMIVTQWKLFRKANLPGWGILIPFYNTYLSFKLAWRPGLRVLWILFPPVFIVLAIMMSFDIAKRFNKHRTFGLWILFLKIIFLPILAFDKKAIWHPKKK